MKCTLISGCENKVFKELKYCALHCSDEDINNDEFNEYLIKFYKLFSDYLDREIKVEIHRNRCGSQSEIEAKDELEKIEQDVEDYHLLVGGIAPYGISTRLTKRLEKIDIILKDYQFPNDNNMEHLDIEYHQVLRCLGRVYFLNCNFNTRRFNLNSNFYYENCIFHNELITNPFPKIENNDYRYKNCLFKKDVCIRPSRQSKEIFCNLFENCNFAENITLSNINFKRTVFHLSQPLENVSIDNIKEHFSKVKSNFKFKKIKIEKCTFESDFKINGLNSKCIESLRLFGCKPEESISAINELEIVDTKFESKLEIKNTSVENFKFTNSNVEKIFDTFQSKFIKAKFSKSIFSDFAGFEEVEFGLIDKKDDISFITIFEHVTFLDFSSFREANFKSGLDFSKTNLKDKPNFLGVKIDSLNTKRETFRIVKSSFDNAGNQIEANKYFVKEMNAYRRELRENKGACSERVILFFNRMISNFGTSYLWPILYLVLFIILYTFLLRTYQNEMQYRTYALPLYLDCITEWLNTGARNFLPFARFVGGSKGFEFVSLLFYIIFGVFIWQIIVAVKRHTQR